MLARLVDRLREQGAAVIAFDVVFAEPDRSSPSAVAKNLPDAVRNTDLRRTLESLPDSDEVCGGHRTRQRRDRLCLRLQRQGAGAAAHVGRRQQYRREE